MESEILNLIQTDQKTREAVEEAHRMKFELKRKIADTEIEDTYTDTGTTFHAEWVELLGFIPGVTSLYEGQTINGCVT